MGYRNTGQLILVPKGDGRQLVFEHLVGGKAPKGKFPLTLKSHAGMAIVTPGGKMNIGDGEQAFMGSARDALQVTWEYGKYIRSAVRNQFWLEIPRDQHIADRAMWFRTLHSKNDNYFGWKINKNGTVSSKKNSKLVLGYGVSPCEQHWKDLTAHYGWTEFMEIEGFSPSQ